MAQTQSPTSTGYGELGKLASGEAATAIKSCICVISGCTASESAAIADVTGAFDATDSGLDLEDASAVASVQTTVANDTVQLDNVFTAADGGNTLKGFAVLNDDDDVVMAICCFAADIAMAASDTLTVQMKMQFKKGS